VLERALYNNLKPESRREIYFFLILVILLFARTLVEWAWAASPVDTFKSVVDSLYY
jgi:hypothetical protein